jgi:hypothetical protein
MPAVLGLIVVSTEPCTTPSQRPPDPVAKSAGNDSGGHPGFVSRCPRVRSGHDPVPDVNFSLPGEMRLSLSGPPTTVADRLNERKAEADARPPAFTPDRNASPADRLAALVEAKLRRMGDDVAAGIDVPVLELQRLADQVSPPAVEDAPVEVADPTDDYDLSRLDAAETATLHALLEKASR